jgi:hypothetical protein
MRRTACLRCNPYAGWSPAEPSHRAAMSGQDWMRSPERMLQAKLMYFHLGLDQLPLRRVAVLGHDKDRLRNAIMTKDHDQTGYRRARASQMTLWHRRMHYQEYHLQHLYTRYLWRLLRYVPSEGAKIPGGPETGYWGAPMCGLNLVTKESLPLPPIEPHPRRK